MPLTKPPPPIATLFQVYGPVALALDPEPALEVPALPPPLLEAEPPEPFEPPAPELAPAPEAGADDDAPEAGPLLAAPPAAPWSEPLLPQ